MAKIIEITENVISIGMDDGSIKEVRPADVNFVPTLGDEVDVFETETRTVVQKKAAAVQPAVPEGGIHINLANTQAAAPASTVVVGGKVVNKLTYCLLTFLLGGIGVHKFYAGKMGAGILYLLFCWTGVPVLIAFIEGIMAVCKSADANGNIIV